MKVKVYKYVSLGDCSCFLSPPFFPNFNPHCFGCTEAYKFSIRKVVFDNKIRFVINHEVKG